MTTLLGHTDNILASKAGEWLIACAPVKGCDMSAGGNIPYPAGAKFRVKFSVGDVIFCTDENARSASFIREDLGEMEKMENLT